VQRRHGAASGTHFAHRKARATLGASPAGTVSERGIREIRRTGFLSFLLDRPF